MTEGGGTHLNYGGYAPLRKKIGPEQLPLDLNWQWSVQFKVTWDLALGSSQNCEHVPVQSIYPESTQNYLYLIPRTQGQVLKCLNLRGKKIVVPMFFNCTDCKPSWLVNIRCIQRVVEYSATASVSY